MRPFHRCAAAALLVCLLAGTASAGAKPREPRRDAAGPDTELVMLGTETHAFVAWPERRQGAPAIVVVHEAWGLDEPIRGVARRLAREGYVAIVPDLYHGRVATGADDARGLADALDADRAYAELGNAIDWLRSRPGTAKSKLGVLGCGLGGELGQGLALRRSELSAAVMFDAMPQTSPRALDHMAAALCAHFGAADDRIPRDSVAALRRGLSEAGRTGEVYVYPGAGHGFMDESRATYHADAARQAWVRTLAFLQRRLK